MKCKFGNIEGDIGDSKNGIVGRAGVGKSWRSMFGNGGGEQIKHILVGSTQLALTTVKTENNMVESQWNLRDPEKLDNLGI